MYCLKYPQSAPPIPESYSVARKLKSDRGVDHTVLCNTMHTESSDAKIKEGYYMGGGEGGRSDGIYRQICIYFVSHYTARPGWPA